MHNFLIFHSPVEIPDTVEQSMEEAFARIKTEKRHSMKKRRWIGYAAAAACAAVVLSFGHIQSEKFPGALEKESSGGAFTMIVNAKELTERKSIPVIQGSMNDGWVMSGSEEESSISYVISSDLACEGDNIESVTYSINNGAFQVIEAADRGSLITDSISTKMDNVGSIGGFWNDDSAASPDKPERPQTERYFKSITFAYENQPDDDIWINICDNVTVDEPTFQNIFPNEDYDATIPDKCESLNNLLRNTVITCEVRYTDGTTTTKDINVIARPITLGELGETENGSPDDITECIFYELKE